MKKLAFLGAALLALSACAVLPALAADTPPANSVAVPWGDLVVDLVNQIVLPLAATAITVLGAMLMWELRKHLPPALQAFASSKNEALLDKLATEGVTMALTKADDSIAGRVVTVQTPNPVVASAAQHIIDNAPAALASSGLGQRAIAAATVKLNALAPPAAVPASAA